MVLIRGIEPSTRWRTFCEDVLELCHSLEVTRVVLLGRAAGRRAVHPVAADQRQRRRTTSDIERFDLTPTRYEGPTGIVGVLQDACRRAELDAVSFWVHVPHYANNPPCPKATLGAAAPGRGGARHPGADGGSGRGVGPVGGAAAHRRRAGRRARPSTSGSSRSAPARTSPRCRATRSPSSSSATCAAAAASRAPPPAADQRSPRPAAFTAHVRSRP